jgi:hypothetical protein
MALYQAFSEIDHDPHVSWSAVRAIVAAAVVAASAAGAVSSNAAALSSPPLPEDIRLSIKLRLQPPRRGRPPPHVALNALTLLHALALNGPLPLRDAVAARLVRHVALLLAAAAAAQAQASSSSSSSSRPLSATTASLDLACAQLLTDWAFLYSSEELGRRSASALASLASGGGGGGRAAVAAAMAAVAATRRPSDAAVLRLEERRIGLPCHVDVPASALSASGAAEAEAAVRRAAQVPPGADQALRRVPLIQRGLDFGAAFGGGGSAGQHQAPPSLSHPSPVMSELAAAALSGSGGGGGYASAAAPSNSNSSSSGFPEDALPPSEAARYLLGGAAMDALQSAMGGLETAERRARAAAAVAAGAGPSGAPAAGSSLRAVRAALDAGFAAACTCDAWRGRVRRVRARATGAEAGPLEGVDGALAAALERWRRFSSLPTDEGGSSEGSVYSLLQPQKAEEEEEEEGRERAAAAAPAGPRPPVAKGHRRGGSSGSSSSGSGSSGGGGLARGLVAAAAAALKPRRSPSPAAAAAVPPPPSPPDLLTGDGDGASNPFAAAAVAPPPPPAPPAVSPSSFVPTRPFDPFSALTGADAAVAGPTAAAPSSSPALQQQPPQPPVVRRVPTNVFDYFSRKALAAVSAGMAGAQAAATATGVSASSSSSAGAAGLPMTSAPPPAPLIACVRDALITQHQRYAADVSALREAHARESAELRRRLAAAEARAAAHEAAHRRGAEG